MTRSPRGAARGRIRPVPAGGREVLGHDRLIGREQPAACLRVIAAGLLLVSGNGADALGEHAAVPQLLVIQQPPDLGQPGLGELAVVVPGDCAKCT
jgi:hypothetical protein